METQAPESDLVRDLEAARYYSRLAAVQDLAGCGDAAELAREMARDSVMRALLKGRGERCRTAMKSQDE